MKKFLNILITFIIIFSLTGCGKKVEVKPKSALEVLNNTLKNENEIHNVKLDMNFNVKMNYGGYSVDGNFNLGTTVSEENGVIKSIIELGDNPFIGKQTIYLDDKNVYYSSKLVDKIYNIETENNDWIITDADNDNETNKYDFKNIDIFKLFNENDFYLLNRNGEIGSYRLVVSKDLLNRIDKYFNPDSSLNFDNFNTTFNIDITIDEKNNRFTNIKSDLTDSLKNMDLDNEYKDVIQNLSFDIKIMYDNININIPDSIKTNAISNEEYFTKIKDLLG